jgi:hypothetical protein
MNTQVPPSHGYGAPTRLPVDESAQCDLLSPHAAVRLAGELYLRTGRQITVTEVHRPSRPRSYMREGSLHAVRK